MTATPVELDDRPGATVVHVRACLDAAVAPDLREALAAAVRRHPHVVIDLAGVHTLDDTGLGVLVRAHRTARRDGGVVCLVAPSRFVLTVLHTMHVDGLFPVFDDCAEALDWLRAGTPYARS
ncbi:anti-sigma-B factor antagonist [Actinoplanes sp. NBRC 14428]|uniref:Anti-sigma B factor antagonist n=1 Tax=Pseudosporangium ferrugineum TaxID=439699 RepID=A0A2T0SIZ1_9ACTN|nr:STAS domain-containing protein [Pseudosporangium ferrugineum]PRY33343.1 anti-sigma B factor antagonist [Pseudosporangium ferrugineum]BCJ48657.1 anti-sigma-B factor antagonist [Actinoplanes sp. NBRC 14428]